MKRFFLSLSVAAVAALCARAQDFLLDNPDNELYFGLRIGAGIACPGDVTVGDLTTDLYRNGTCYEIGGICRIPIAANFYMEPGLKLVRSEYSVNDQWVKDYQDDIIYESIKIRRLGMRMPVMAGYHFDFSDDLQVSIFTGPELEIGFSAKEIVSGPNIEISESMYGDGRDMRRTNVLWAVGAGISYRNFYLEMKNAMGMTNMVSTPGTKFHESHVAFSVGYNF